MRVKRNSSVVEGACLLAIVVAVFVASLLRGQSQYPDADARAAATPYKTTFFDPDPQHPWNRLYGLLFIRPAWDGNVYGENEVDPLYWNSSRYLFEQPLHQKTLTLLDQFIQNDSAHLVKSPLKRALLQSMLWALFDRCAFYLGDDGKRTEFDIERRELQTRLAKIMRAVALTDDEIGTLPHNYELQAAAKTYPTEFDPDHAYRPFLPATFYAGKDWVRLDGTNYDLLAPVHVERVSGRSAFDIFISLPTGRSDTLAYLKKLDEFHPQWVYDQAHRVMTRVDMGNKPPWPNIDTPQVPLLTKFALIRTANLVNAAGEIRTSPLVQSVQMRVIRSILPMNSTGGDQDLFFFSIDEKKLMEGEGGLVAKGKSDASFDMVLGGGGIDPLQGLVGRGSNNFHGESVRVASCMSCHNSPGIFSMNSYIQFFQNNRTLQPPLLREGDDAGFESTVWKRRQYDWGLLQAYWFAQ